MATDRPDILANYLALVAKVDELCGRIEAEFGPHLACRAGCSGCCRHITLSWVEAVALNVALRELSAEQAEAVRQNARTAATEGPCPLLIDERCALYASRPIICRTHGLPILTVRDDARSIDFCPLNFQGLDTLPGNAVVDLERLNTLLDSVNRLFIAQCFEQPPAMERLSIAEALLLDIDM